MGVGEPRKADEREGERKSSRVKKLKHFLSLTKTRIRMVIIIKISRRNTYCSISLGNW